MVIIGNSTHPHFGDAILFTSGTNIPKDWVQPFTFWQKKHRLKEHVILFRMSTASHHGDGESTNMATVVWTHKLWWLGGPMIKVLCLPSIYSKPGKYRTCSRNKDCINYKNCWFLQTCAYLHIWLIMIIHVCSCMNVCICVILFVGMFARFRSHNIFVFCLPY